MTKYLVAFIKSFYSPEIYRDAITKWRGFGGRYMIFVSAILAVILAVCFYISLVQFEKEELPFITKQIPPITVEDGVVSVTAKQPVIIQSKDKQVTMIVDTEKSMSELREMHSQFAIGKDFVLIKGRDNNYKPMELKSLKGKVIVDEANINKFVSAFKFAAFPLLWLGQALNLFVKLLVVTILSYVVTAFMREEYDFVTRMRLSILALTPGVLISTVLELALNHQVAPWFFMLLACLYIYVMIVLMRKLPPVENTLSI